jgi:hypothetical protein
MPKWSASAFASARIWMHRLVPLDSGYFVAAGLTVVIPCCSYLLDPSCQVLYVVVVLLLMLISRLFLPCIHNGDHPV